MTIARACSTEEQMQEQIDFLLTMIFRYCQTNKGNRFFNPIIITRRCECSAKFSVWAWHHRDRSLKQRLCVRCDRSDDYDIPF